MKIGILVNGISLQSVVEAGTKFMGVQHRSERAKQVPINV